ncbi:hypothetical protein [Amycolatopsis lexingtonensis]|uniref:hypothetical protein n=1 Tax=Amycolatopsis lexingtonensis TaxID=218822 RepID=UPI001CEF0D1C|nr:hypothetical protein [Amycolatopsis lexingtonensis]
MGARFLVGDKRGEGLRQGGSLHRAVLADVELLEEPAVDLPLYVVRRGQVGLLAVAGGYDRSPEDVFHFSGGNLGRLDLGLSLGQLLCQTLHLGAKDVLRDGPGVVRLEQLLALVGDASLASSGSL